MDEVDQAQVEIEGTIARQLKEIPPLVIENPGKRCWNCGANTSAKKRWCNSDCRDDWEWGQKFKATGNR